MSTLVQGSEEWLAQRRKMIGASDAPVIMGVSPWSTPYKLWAEKLELVKPRPQTKVMSMGLKKEDKARQCFTKETGIFVKPDVLFHPKIPFMMASLDGICKLGMDIVEIKCPGIIDHHIAKEGEIPEKYYPQLQHQLEVCGLDMVYYYSFRKESDTALLQVRRDQTYIDRLLEKEEEFWDHVINFTSPELMRDDVGYAEMVAF